MSLEANNFLLQQTKAFFKQLDASSKQYFIDWLENQTTEVSQQEQDNIPTVNDYLQMLKEGNPAQVFKNQQRYGKAKKYVA